VSHGGCGHAAKNRAIGVAHQVKSMSQASTKAKVQTEISQSQKLLTRQRRVFSGQNWLSVGSSAAGYNAPKSIVSSFTRTGTGVVIQLVDVGTQKMMRLDANRRAPVVAFLTASAPADGTTTNSSGS